MSALPRGFCGICGQDVAVRRNGTAREHHIRDPFDRLVVCLGSGKAVRALKKQKRGGWSTLPLGNRGAVVIEGAKRIRRKGRDEAAPRARDMDDRRGGP